jgi:hypothetical protein
MSWAPAAASVQGRTLAGAPYSTPLLPHLRGRHMHLQRPQTRDDSSEQNDEPPLTSPETSRVGLTVVTGRGKGAGDGAVVQPDRALPDPLWRGARGHDTRPERRAPLLRTRSVAVFLGGS